MTITPIAPSLRTHANLFQVLMSCHDARECLDSSAQLRLCCAQVLEEVAEWVKVFDEVNVATALHRLAKLQPPGTAGPQSPVLRSAAFQLLVEACQRLVPRFEAQGRLQLDVG